MRVKAWFFFCAHLFLVPLSPLMGEELFTPSTEIYVPGPQFKDLNRPVTDIRSLPALPQVYRGLGVSSPRPYSHYNYLYYGAYNYRMQAYPYQVFAGGGRRSPHYFAWNQRSERFKGEKLGQKLGEVRIITVKSRLTHAVEGEISAKKLIPFWVQAVGFKRPPPMVSRRDRAAFLNTPGGSPPRIIQSVDFAKKRGKSPRIQVSFKPSALKGARFYQEKDEDYSAVLSLAIFKNLDIPVEFSKMDDKKEPEEEDSSPDAEFLNSGRLGGEISDSALYRPRSNSGAMDISLQSREDLRSIQKYLDLSDRDLRDLKEVDFEKEIVYLTGRAFSSRANALDLSDRKIVRVSDMGSRRIKHLVEVEETRSSRERLSPEDKDHEDLFFSGFYVVLERPRDYGGYRFGVTVKD